MSSRDQPAPGADKGAEGPARPRPARRPPLDKRCAELVRELRERCPGVIPDDPLPHGEPSKPVPVEPKQAAQLVGLAARQAAAVAALGRVPASDKELPGVVIWEQGGAAVAVGLAELDVAFGDGVIVVALPVWCDQLKDHKDLVQVTFAVGAPGRPTGLLAATPRRPRGPQVVLDGWGEQLVALAWQAVLDTAAGVAAQVGTDTDGTPLVATALSASGRGLEVIPQARHEFDRLLTGRAVIP